MVAMSLCTTPSVIQGYTSTYPSYGGMTAQSDLVVIATPVARQEQGEDAQLPGVSQGPNWDPVPAVGIETSFSILAVLKGDEKLTGGTFALVHYREKVKDTSGTYRGGPALVDFKPGEGSAYLMFLKDRGDGHFEAVHAIEPGWCILKLPQGTKPFSP